MRLLATSIALVACSAPTPPAAPPPAPAPTATTPSAAPEAGSTRVIEVPNDVPQSLLERRRVASALLNPRGLLPRDDGSILVSEAGRGDPDNPNTGTLLRLRDKNADGDFDDAGERTRILEGMVSTNIIEIVRRDEVFGMASVVVGDGIVLAAHAMFGSPTKLFKVEGDRAAKWGFVHGNLNSIDFDPKRGQWFAASSSSDEVVRVRPDGAERILKFPPLAQGQDAVPGYVRYDPATEQVLVSLFSGSPAGEEGGSGIELVRRAGSVVSVQPDTKKATPIVTGLTAPTDLVVDGDDLYVLEFCDGFLDPIESREAMAAHTGHGGFRRYSGRLLKVDRAKRTVTLLADGLDTPTNLALEARKLYVAQGMGTPGRKIPGPSGPVELDGFIEVIELGK